MQQIAMKIYLAIFCTMMLLLPIMANGERLISYDKMYLSVSTDKRVYYKGDTATYTVTFKDSDGKPIDPDLIRATYNSQFIQLQRIGDGVYTFKTGTLTQRDHQLGVYAEKDGYNFVQQSLTLRPVATQKASDKVKAIAVQQGNILKFRLSNDLLSKRDIYKVRLITIGATVESVASDAWIKVPDHIGVDLKSVKGSISPDEKQTIKLSVQGKVSTVVWNAYDSHGKQIYAGVANVPK